MNISGRRLSGPTLFVLCLLVCSAMVATLPTIPAYADSQRAVVAMGITVTITPRIRQDRVKFST
jgi:hypothetical protein